MTRRLSVALALVVSAAGLSTLGQLPADAATSAVPRPMKIVTNAVAGPGVGQLTISWRRVKSAWKPRTTGFRIETATTQFSPYHSSLPLHGRNSHVFSVGPKARKLVLSGATLAAAGAPLASGNHLYVRVWSVDKVKHRGTRTYSDGTMRAVRPRGMASTGTGGAITFGSYNIRDRNLDDPGTTHAWSNRLPLVAANIHAHPMDLFTLEEASPYFGVHAKYREAQPDTLIDALRGLGDSQYQLADMQLGDPQGSGDVAATGNRIVYDKTRFTQLPSPCTGGADCDVTMPGWATYGHFQEKTTGQRFWTIAFHLATGHNTSKTYNDQRRREIAAVYQEVARFNTDGEPIIAGGDMNDFQNSQGPDAFTCHEYLVDHGFYDTAAAAVASNLKYPTANHFGARAGDAITGTFGPRLDAILTKGMVGADRFTNVVYHPGGQWPSDHNLVTAIFKLP